MPSRSRSLAIAGGACLLASASAALPPRERAVQQIPELMGRILDSQEAIRERESELAPVIERHDRDLAQAKGTVDAAGSEEEAAEALVDYVEAYAARLEAQEQGLRSMEGAVARMRADARDLVHAAGAAGDPRDPPAERRAFFQDHFQGVASGIGVLAERLGRAEEAATAGAVLHASWASHGNDALPLAKLGPEGAAAFARKVEGLYARHQARSNQLRVERHAVRRLLDVLIERQLARRLDALFAGDRLTLGAILSGEGLSEDWQDLGRVVSRAIGLPSGAGATADSGASSGPSLDRLDYFASGGHRE